MQEAYICDGVRSPIGRYGGALAHVRPDDLAARQLAALIARNPAIDPYAIDEVFLGCANQSGEDNRNVARMSLLLAGLPVTVPGMTVNRLCASGMEAVGAAMRAIRLGEMDLALAGGVESMTRAPLVLGKNETAFGRGQALQDTTMGWRFVNPALEKMYGTETMPQTGENVARQFGISREDQDAFAVRSQQRADAAQKAGFFAEEIAPLTVRGPNRGREILFDADEHMRPDTSVEKMAALRPLFGSDGTVTAGNASGINDGAAVMIVASGKAANAHGLEPKARILGMASAGIEPRIMGMAPLPAIRKLLAHLDLSIEDFGVVELNEAFASQCLACVRALGLSDDADHVNPHGGAIALGHPLGMTGARLVQTTVHAMQLRGAKRGLAALCVGVGIGLAMAFEID